MKGKLKSWIVSAIIVLVLLLPILVSYFNGKHLEIIDYNTFNYSVNNDNFSLVYFGNTDSSSFEKIEKKLVNVKNEYNVKVSAVNTSILSRTEMDKLTEMDEIFSKSEVYVFTVDGEIRKVVSIDDKTVDLEKLTNKLANNVIPEEEIAYKTLNTYKEFTKVINSKTTVMHVFGRNSCSWCNKFKPIYNDAASEYKVNIYYYDSDSFDSKEYDKILKSGLMIPGECTSTKKDSPLSDGFGTPLTLFTKKGKVVGCISGYTNYSGLINKLTSVGMIK